MAGVMPATLLQLAQVPTVATWTLALVVAWVGSSMMVSMKWGLVPGYHKQGQALDHWRMFNARHSCGSHSPEYTDTVCAYRYLRARWGNNGLGKQQQSKEQMRYNSVPGKQQQYKMLLVSPTRRITTVYRVSEMWQPWQCSPMWLLAPACEKKVNASHHAAWTRAGR
ncbi:hypothetical protein HaLaN_04890 [Haematococcus lacustris]|uniref:Uncharacterized protein n=1 Tax=Haematococcus lacustris TaxID=44745 RepID=A0A699YHL7_HAELA|nr:hypothetical protein HaLaN_04890 [Haematococcus lacustris]